MITTIEHEHGQVKSIALDGISLLEKKTAEVAADATIRTFYQCMSLNFAAVLPVPIFRAGEWRYGHGASFNVSRGMLLYRNGLGVPLS